MGNAGRSRRQPFRHRLHRLKILRAAAIAAALMLLAGACSSGADKSLPPESDGHYEGKTVKLGQTSLPARIQDEQVALGRGDHFEPRFWAGVNLGATTPGFSPGEVSPSRADFDRWFKQMSLLGVRVVRVYTIQRPAFYDALKAFNTANPTRPLYVIHGVWIPEEEFLATQNAYADSVTQGFRDELKNAVAVIHGDIKIPAKPGHASGKYRSDISPWLLAWSIGVEMDPEATVATNEKNAGVPPYRGTYITSSADASPIESWLESMLDYIAARDSERGWSRPLTFTNWLTADPLHHPEEPLPKEDAVSIDPMHMTATENWPAGFFASYHAYPYYPDFLGLQPSYQDYKRPQDGKIDPYAGYLADLRAHHKGQAVMITEFGMPTSIGHAHTGPLGRNQGGHSETAAASHVADMMSDIKAEGFAGGVVFEWTDEWFKFTWNTIEYELPQDRRQYWRNPLTNEEHFGLLAMEPGKKTAVTLDGSDREWKNNNSKVIAKHDGIIDEIKATHDAEYLYLLLKTKPQSDLKGSTLAFDVRPGGNGGIKGRPGTLPDADVQIEFDQDGKVVLNQAAWTDPFSWQFGVALKYVPVDPSSLQQGSGSWVPVRQVQNKPTVIPSSGVQRPVETSTLESMSQGTTDPSKPDFDDRNLVMTNGAVTEIRIPWSFLTFSDPSTHQVYTPQPDGTIKQETVGKMNIALVDNNGGVISSKGYKWDNWNLVDWHERKKNGWPQLEQMFKSAAS